METVRALQQVASPALDQLMLWITGLGSERAYVALLLIAYLGVGPSKGRRLAVYFLVGSYLNQQLKDLFETARPFELDPTVLRSEAAGETVQGSGFPSGHAQSSTTYWGLAALYVGRRIFTLLAILLIALVSISRVFLGVHFPVDVVGGVLLGLAVVSLGAGLDRLWYPPDAWLGVMLGIAIPLLLHLLFPTPESNLILGGLAGFLTGPIFVIHRPPRSLLRRVLISLLGLVLVFGYLFGASAVLPGQVRDHALWGFIYYLALTYVGLVLVPLLGRALRLGRPAS